MRTPFAVLMIPDLSLEREALGDPLNTDGGLTQKEHIFTNLSPGFRNLCDHSFRQWISSLHDVTINWHLGLMSVDGKVEQPLYSYLPIDPLEVVVDHRSHLHCLLWVRKSLLCRELDRTCHASRQWP